MLKKNAFLHAALPLTLFMLLAGPAHAAISLDRTRVVFDGAQKSVSVFIENQNHTQPYLAQSWVADAQGNKIESLFVALPPLQRVEPGAKSQVKIQATGNLASLPQNRESLYYFNVREIPPKSSKPNTLQLSLQTRLKMFYRPPALALKKGSEDDIFKGLTLTREGDHYSLNNPTAYYVTAVSLSSAVNGKPVNGFTPGMAAPTENVALAGAAQAGEHPVVTVVNDFGGRPQLTFDCHGEHCTVANIKAG
ncbi:molecular chaperone [Enterobacteriaceae bacterium 89]|nr:molecular chaperone [Enterobacteriaceae bacterium 89]